MRARVGACVSVRARVLLRGDCLRAWTWVHVCVRMNVCVHVCAHADARVNIPYWT